MRGVPPRGDGRGSVLEEVATSDRTGLGLGISDVTWCNWMKQIERDESDAPTLQGLGSFTVSGVRSGRWGWRGRSSRRPPLRPGDRRHVGELFKLIGGTRRNKANYAVSFDVPVAGREPDQGGSRNAVPSPPAKNHGLEMRLWSVWRSRPRCANDLGRNGNWRRRCSRQPPGASGASPACNDDAPLTRPEQSLHDDRPRH